MSLSNVRVFKVRPTAKLPHRAHSTDAGMDLFYCPQDETELIIDPSCTALLQTGVKVEVPNTCMLQVMNKSGVASKKQLLAGACVVDEGYTGEIFVNLHNVGSTPQTVVPGQKIAQAVFVKIEKPLLVEIQTDEIYDSQTSRGSGALGSTGEV